MSRLVYSLALLFFAVPAFAGPFDKAPGLIPKVHVHRVANDLVDPNNPNRVLSETEAEALQMDLADLNPKSRTLWNAEGVYEGRIYERFSAPIEVESGDTVEFVGQSDDSLPLFKLDTIKSSRGDQKRYRTLFSPRVHNILLRKALLEKIGYFVPPVKYIPKIKIKFKRSSDIRTFLKRFSSLTLGVPSRWAENIKKEKVVPTEEQIAKRVDLGEKREDVIADLTRNVWDIDPEASEDDKTLVLHDLVVLPERDLVDDMSAGLLDIGFIDGKRLFSSLLVPFNLTDVPESVNKFSPIPGRVINDGVLLRFSMDPQGQIRPTWEDAEWITRKISLLDRDDWKDVVNAGNYPHEVGSILLEKLISRRNWIRKHFAPGVGPKLKPKLRKSIKPLLVKGVLQKSTKSIEDSEGEFEDWWAGYGSRFSFGPDDSPYSFSEIFAFFRSRLYSQFFINGADEVNRQLELNSEDRNRDDALENQLDIARKQFEEFLRTGRSSKAKISTWTTPFYSGDLIVTRDVVLGGFLGAENKVQLADTVGVALAAGGFMGLNGGPKDTPIGARATGTYTVRYTHLKPIKSIKAALDEPVTNVLVNWLKKKAAKSLDPLVGQGLYGDLDNDVETALRKRYGDQVNNRNQNRELVNALNECSAADVNNYNEELRGRALGKLSRRKNILTDCKNGGLCDTISEVADLISEDTPNEENEDLIAKVDELLAENTEAINTETSREYPAMDETQCQDKKSELQVSLDDSDSDLSEKRQELFEVIQQNKINSVLTIFKEHLGVGESFIISQGLGGKLGINISHSLDQKNRLMARFEAGLDDLSRTHIVRASKDVIQVYRSGALFNSFSVPFRFEAFSFPVFQLGPRWRSSLGKIKKYDTRFNKDGMSGGTLKQAGQNSTYFFQINLNAGEAGDDREELITNVTALMELLDGKGTELLEDNIDPVIVQHDWGDFQFPRGFLWWKWFNHSSYDEIHISDRRVEDERFQNSTYIRKTTGTRTGRNYEKTAIDIIQAALEENEVADVQIANIGTNNPGDSFLGNSYYRKTTFEARKRIAPVPLRSESDYPVRLDMPFIDISFRWKGWSMKLEEAQALVKTINEKFDFNVGLNTSVVADETSGQVKTMMELVNRTEFYDPEKIAGFTELKLYRIDVNIYMYQEGVNTLLGLDTGKNTAYIISNEDLVSFVMRNAKWKKNQSTDRRSRIARRFVSLRGEFLKQFKKGNTKNATKAAVKLASLAEEVLPIAAFRRLVGGQLYVRSTIDGFREGVEDAETPIFSNSLGRFGDRERKGPLQAIQSNLGMTESEFFFYWILGQF